MEINFVLCVFLKILKKILESPITNNGSVCPDGFTAFYIFIQNLEK
jgi:hypothetical protein